MKVRVNQYELEKFQNYIAQITPTLTKCYSPDSILNNSLHQNLPTSIFNNQIRLNL